MAGSKRRDPGSNVAAAPVAPAPVAPGVGASTHRHPWPSRPLPQRPSAPVAASTSSNEAYFSPTLTAAAAPGSGTASYTNEPTAKRAKTGHYGCATKIHTSAPCPPKRRDVPEWMQHAEQRCYGRWEGSGEVLIPDKVKTRVLKNHTACQTGNYLETVLDPFECTLLRWTLSAFTALRLTHDVFALTHRSAVTSA